MGVARLVCVEGIDGAGKSTLVQALVAELARLGVRATSLHARSLVQLSLGERDTLDTLGELTLQDRAFVSFSRLYSHYCNRVASQLAGCDLVLMDRYKWSVLVRWGCYGVNWGMLCSLAAGFDLLPHADHTLLLAASPADAYDRKKAAGIALTRPELGMRTLARSEREAFVALQTQAQGFYADLHLHARAGSVTQIDTGSGPQAALAQALAVLGPLLSR